MTTLDQRYGAKQRPRWFWPVIATIGIGIGVAWAAWIALQDRPVSADVWGYDVRSDTSTVVTVEVRRPEPLAVTCTVAAVAEDHQTVGERTVEVPAGDAQRERVDVTVRTERRAVTGVLRGCRADG